MKVVLLLGVGLTVAVFFGMGLVAEEPPRVPTVCPKDAYLCNMEVMNQSNPGCRHREDHSNTQCMICKRDIAGTEVRMCQATTDPNAPGCNFVGEKITCGLKEWGECRLENGEWVCRSLNSFIGHCEFRNCETKADDAIEP